MAKTRLEYLEHFLEVWESKKIANEVDRRYFGMKALTNPEAKMPPEVDHLIGLCKEYILTIERMIEEEKEE